MKIGMPALYGCDSIEENFVIARELGFDFVELNVNFSYCRKELLDKRLMRRLIDTYGKETTLHFFDEADFGTYDEVARSYYILLKKYVKAAAPYNLKNLIVHIIDGPVATI